LDGDDGSNIFRNHTDEATSAEQEELNMERNLPYLLLNETRSKHRSSDGAGPMATGALALLLVQLITIGSSFCIGTKNEKDLNAGSFHTINCA
jgi:hypothetical protein